MFDLKLSEIASKIKDVLFIAGPIFSIIIFFGGLAIKNTETYKEFIKVVEYGYYAKEILLPKSDSIHAYQDNKIKELEILIGQRFPSEQHTFSLGLRYDINKKRIYFRDEHKELRPVLYEGGTGFYYYRDSRDIKRYVNY